MIRSTKYMIRSEFKLGMLALLLSYCTCAAPHVSVKVVVKVVLAKKGGGIV